MDYTDTQNHHQLLEKTGDYIDRLWWMIILSEKLIKSNDAN